MRKMDNGKTEEGGIAIDFFKNLPRMWLKEVLEVLNETFKRREMA